MRRLYKLIAQILIVSMVWMPFSIHAGMVGTDQVVASAQDQLNRDKVASFMSRSDVVKQLESFGISASSAKERVNAMTQDEVNKVAGKIDSMPTGAGDEWWIVAVIVIGIIIWLVWYRK
jgi:poly-D-alanine transfer protein DltD